MKRRTLLKNAAVAALGASFPKWLRSAYAGESCDQAVSPAQGLVALSEGYRAAHRAGRPLLVLVIPQKKDERWAPGRAFGELLNNATPEQMLPFAMVEVVCARMAVLKQLVPSVDAGEPLMVLVETDRSAAKARFLDAKLNYEYAGWDKEELAEKLIDARIEAIGNLVRGATLDEPYLSRYVAQNRAGLTQAEQAAISSGDISDALLDRAGPLLVSMALSGQSEALKQRLVARATSLLKVKPPRGAHWANARGCGTDVEGLEEASVLIGCGMGHTPERSRRFLYFFRHAELSKDFDKEE
jgi:hypothetical protein